MLMQEVVPHSCGAALTRRVRLAAVRALGHSGSLVVGILDEVKPNFASGLATIDAIVC
jgi:hypothetical protein